MVCRRQMISSHLLGKSVARVASRVRGFFPLSFATSEFGMNGQCPAAFIPTGMTPEATTPQSPVTPSLDGQDFPPCSARKVRFDVTARQQALDLTVGYGGVDKGSLAFGLKTQGCQILKPPTRSRSIGHARFAEKAKKSPLWLKLGPQFRHKASDCISRNQVQKMPAGNCGQRARRDVRQVIEELVNQKQRSFCPLGGEISVRIAVQVLPGLQHRSWRHVSGAH